MASPDNAPNSVASVEDIQTSWADLTLKVAQLEALQAALEQDNKALHTLLERVIEHRQKSHSELVLILSGLVSKLPVNDVGLVVSKLVEHNKNVTDACAVLAKGKLEAGLPQPAILKALEQTKRDLVAAAKPAVEELIKLETPLDPNFLRSLPTQPDAFFAPAAVRANRCFVKGQVPRERILREFGEEAMVFFNDLTTDAKLNPRPRPEEIALGFKSDFETLFAQNASVIPDKRQDLLALHQKVQRSKSPEQARLQKNAFQRLSFLLDLARYYENQNTEAADAIFAQRMPGLIEQLVLPNSTDKVDKKAVAQAEELLGFIINLDHRLMVINNMGKSGGDGKTLKYVLRLRAEKTTENYEVLAEFAKHLVPTKTPPTPQSLTPTLQLLTPELQPFVVKALMTVPTLRREEGEALGQGLAKELGLTLFHEELKAQSNVPPETERQMAWEAIRQQITQRADAGAITAAMRDRLHAKYDADEVRQSWLVLAEADTMSFIKIFCSLPYRSDGKTDPIARPVMETYVTRLTHEKYAATYSKVVNSLKNMFKAKPDSPTLMNFLALVKWVDPEAAVKLSNDIGIPQPVH